MFSPKSVSRMARSLMLPALLAGGLLLSAGSTFAASGPGKGGGGGAPAAPAAGPSFTCTVSDSNINPEGKDRTTAKLSPAAVAGKTMHCQGSHASFDANLDSLAIINYTVDGVVLHSSVTSPRDLSLNQELQVQFDRDRIRISRRGVMGEMQYTIEDSSSKSVLNMSPNPRQPDRMDVTYTLGAGITYQGIEIDPVLGPVCVFGGVLNGIEATNPKDVERSKIMSCQAGAQSSTWDISALGSVDTKLQ